MAKASRSVQFRKVDVDQFNEEAYQEGDGDSEINGSEGPNEDEVRNLLSQSKKVDALTAVLRCPPIGTKNQTVKDKAFQLVLDVLLAFKTSEVDQGVKSLDPSALDVLMKYIYRGFEKPTEGSSAALLTWHEKVFAAGGIGSIVRVLTDRKRV